jgi:hypothetical protein
MNANGIVINKNSKKLRTHTTYKIFNLYLCNSQLLLQLFI